ncbi:MAG: ATP-binding protein [Bacteroidales bacterium]|nr:ATP-binding protein [Bacteroidales bacterium]
MYGRVINIILLSLVIGNRLNMYSIKEKKARAKELSAIRERDRIIAQQQEKLKKIVEERNKEILSKIDELSKQQQELEKQTNEISEKNNEIDKYNKELDIKNKKIEEQNRILKEYKEELEQIVEIRKKELQIEMDRAEVANKLKTSFLNNLSNEIRVPLNTITDFATLLVHKSTDKKQRNEYLRAIIQNTGTLLSLIEDVLTLSRIQSGIVKLKKSEFKPEELIHSLVDDFNDKLFETGKKNLKIKAKIPKENRIVIIHDYDKIWQVFNQLISNAIKFTDKGYIEIAYSVELKNKDLGQVRFYVKDTGKGMSEKEIKEFLYDNQNKNYHKKGLGLAIVKEFIKLFGGTIHVKSEINNGTIFYFEFETELKTIN